MKRNFVLFCAMALIYLCVEVIFRALIFNINNYTHAFKYLSLIGFASLWMLPIGGFIGVILGWFNHIRWMNKNINIFWQSIIASTIILIVEYFSGIILNGQLGLNLWDYSKIIFNINGQVCLLFGILWILISPFAFWADDQLRWLFYREGQPYSVIEIYKKFFDITSRPYN